MKKRILSLLLAVSIACSMLVVPANAAASNAAVQTAVTLGGLTSEQASALSTALTRGQLAKLLVAFSAYRESAVTQGNTGTLFTDVDSGNEYAPYIRIAVQQGWLSGYTDGSFRPDNGVTLEEACTAALKLLGYEVTTLSGSFPAAQLNKAGSLGLRADLSAVQGQGLTLEDAAVLFYNALTASTAENQTYAATLGFTVTDGRIDLSSVLLSSVEGPFVADGTTQLPFAPAAVYRNDTVATDAALNAYDVYYYSASARTVWIYSRKAAGRITAVSPSASAPTSVTVAGTSYTLASSAAASVLSSLNGGGVGQVVPAVGHEQRGGGRSDWRGSRQRVLWRGADFFPQPDRGKWRGCAPKRAGGLHRWRDPHRECGQEPELSRRLAGEDHRQRRR